MAAAAIAADADLQEKRVLIAIDAHLDKRLDLPARGALAPELAAGARPIPSLLRLERLRERRVVHVGDHEHLARVGVGRDRGDQPVRAEARREGGAFLELALRSGDREEGG